MTECIFQSVIENVKADVEEMLDSVPASSHLLLLVHPFRDDLVHRRFGESSRYPRSTTKAAAAHSPAFSALDVLEATSLRPLSEVHQPDQSPNNLTVPKAPLHRFELIQRMAANRSLRET
jgi:hypothetical protein